jgi:hypothetical protein
LRFSLRSCRSWWRSTGNCSSESGTTSSGFASRWLSYQKFFFQKKPLRTIILFLLFNTQTMHIKLFYTQQHCYVSLKALYPGGIWTWVFLFLRRMRCPLRHAARTSYQKFEITSICTLYIFCYF